MEQLVEVQAFPAQPALAQRALVPGLVLVSLVRPAQVQESLAFPVPVQLVQPVQRPARGLQAPLELLVLAQPSAQQVPLQVQPVELVPLESLASVHLAPPLASARSFAGRLAQLAASALDSESAHPPLRRALHARQQSHPQSRLDFSRDTCPHRGSHHAFVGRRKKVPSS